MRRTAILTPLLTGLYLIATPLHGHAEEVDALKRIKASGLVNIGYRENSIPFSYLDQGKPVGYAHDLSLKIVDRIKSELKRPDLRVNMVPLTSFNRFDLVRDGQVDFECGSTSNTRDRQNHFAFSNTYFVSATRFATQKYSELNSFNDLNNKPVAVTFGSTAEQLMQQKNNEIRQKGGFNRPIKLIPVRSHADGMDKLAKKSAEAFVMDDVLLYSLINESAHPEEWKVVGEMLAMQAYACMLRKDDPKLKRLMDSALSQMMQSGEAEKLYQRWFLSPIPPHNRNLNILMSAELKKLFTTPSDKPYD